MVFESSLMVFTDCLMPHTGCYLPDTGCYLPHTGCYLPDTGGNTPYTYNWTPAPGAGQGTAAVTSLAAGTYSCLVTTTNGCTFTQNVTITQPTGAPAITIASTNASCNPGHDGTATATLTGGTGPFTYTWAPAPGGGQGTLNATGLSAGTYTLTVTPPPNGCGATATVTITQPPGAPVISIASTNASCSPGNDGTATATITGGTGPFTYTWAPAPGGGQGSTNATAMSPGLYTLTVAPTTGCGATDTVRITAPSGVTSTASSVNVTCFGLSNGSATLTASGGTPPLTYAWTGGPTVVASTTGIATALAAGTYTCIVKDGAGCSSTQIFPITQPALLTLNASGINATCSGLCNGQLICIPAGGTAAYTFSWSTGCLSASCNGICAAIYTATVTDAHGCIATDTAIVNQPTPLVMSMFPTAAHCNKSDGHDSVFVSGGTPTYTYSWTPAGGTGATTTAYHAIPAAAYTVLVLDNHGCRDSMNNVVPNLPGVVLSPVSTTRDTCFGSTNGTATVSAAGGFPAYTYSWSPAPASGQTTVTATGLSMGAYTCTVTDSASCISSVVMNIGQPTPVTLPNPAPATVCIGGCTTLSATGAGGSPGYTYTWAQGATLLASLTVCPLLTTTYTAICTDTHGCVSPPATVTIIVNPPLVVVAAGDTSICPGQQAQLNAAGHGGDNILSYTWKPVTGLSNPNIPNPVATPAVTTTYTVTISDACGTPTDSSFATVTLYPPPVVNFTSKDTTKCAPVCVTFYGTSAPACASASWNFGDAGAVATGCDSAKHCYMTAGSYTVTYSVIDVQGCPGSKVISNFINAKPVPVAAFSASPQPTTIIDPEIYFTNQSSADAITWNWTFAELQGATSILQNPNYTYPDTGCYPVTLIVTAADGCSDTVEHPVCIQPYFTFYAPNTFTPNGDGKNDVWTPFGIGIDPANYHLMMFDRWGNLMWETYVWGEGWDGRANHGANIAQIDTYVWKVDLKDVFHDKHSYIGHCNIIK